MRKICGNCDRFTEINDYGRCEILHAWGCSESDTMNPRLDSCSENFLAAGWRKIVINFKNKVVFKVKKCLSKEQPNE